ncbi:hypothetical protein H4R99_003614 [Coemansia sp. RSA 1722]|nr:hypothetical protein LPJ57_001497 [Coemansia sp. RSA 486]KAJ2229806.1 hypothetical protein IWW45_006047 [Coemansia sp. RSA 485]KAJ2599699.1 hypothetical protein H4R99_003614 [Coemansia sp. RSA 1722]
MLISVEKIIGEAIDEASDDLRKLSAAIHDHPERAMKEYKASDLLCTYLINKGFSVERQVGGLETSFVASYTSPAGASGLCIGFCSEYDALPDIGHGCGHNLIAISGIAMFLGIAQVLETCRVPGIVKLFGTPAEEDIGGKIKMLDQGVFEGTDVLMMLHPTAGYSGSWHSQCCLEMVVEYFGRSSHAAMAPWDGINAGSASVIALQILGVMREQLKPDWRTHGIITHGGSAPNVIPAYSRIEYTVRTSTEKDLEVLRKRVLRCFDAAALASGCTHKVTEAFAYLDNEDNPVLGSMYEELMYKQYRVPPVRGVGGSTDFGNLSKRFISLHGMFDQAGTGVPNHTVEFARDARTEEAHKRTIFAAKSTALIAGRCLVDVDFWNSVKHARKQKHLQ